VDEVATRLFNKSKVHDFIVIGIWNTETRYTEYFPQKPVEALTKKQKDILIQQLQETISTATDLNLHLIITSNSWLQNSNLSLTKLILFIPKERIPL
jgi:hypothetical protein